MTAIQMISAEAKKIRKKYPYKDWKNCIKEASAIYNSKHKGKVSGTKKPTKKSLHKDTKSHNVNIRVVSGIPKSKVAKKSVKEVLQKSGYRMPHGYNLVKGNVRSLSGVFSKEELEFIEKEGKKSKNYNYRAKVLWGQYIVLKETKNGTPIQKWIVDDYDKGKLIADELNKGQKYHKLKGSKIK